MSGEDTKHLLHVFPSFAVGGQQIRMVTLANALGPGFRHTVYALDGDLAAAARLGPAVDAAVEPVRLAKSRLLSLRNLLAIRRRLAVSRADILLTNNWGSIEWALAQRLASPIPRHIHFEDGFGPEESVDRQLPRRVRFRRLALCGAEIVLPSRTLHRIATEVWGFDPDRVLYIPNGVDAVRFEREGDPALAERLCRQPGEIVIGSVGGLRPEKNFGRLLRTAASLGRRVPLRLAIAGTGPDETRLRALAAELGIADRTVLLGQIDGPERLLPHFDVFVISSDTEQMPLALLEAMAAGLPVAATDVGDISAIVAAANRPYVVPAADEAALSEAVHRLAVSADARRALGMANRERARAEFSLDGMISIYRQLFTIPKRGGTSRSSPQPLQRPGHAPGG
jgi:glycosyltransferase involved in cell wall biosynthesis